MYIYEYEKVQPKASTQINEEKNDKLLTGRQWSVKQVNISFCSCYCATKYGRAPQNDNSQDRSPATITTICHCYWFRYK